MADMINHPPHYNDPDNFFGQETIVTIDSLGIGPEYCLGNFVKYMDRAGKKPGSSLMDDVKKAQWYLSRYLKYVEFKYDKQAAYLISCANHLNIFISSGCKDTKILALSKNRLMEYMNRVRNFGRIV